MRLAVPFDHGQIYGHFGRTAQFKLYDVTDGRIVSTAIVDTMGNGHGALTGFLKAYAVDALICGGIGAGARTALAQAGIELYPGVSGDALAAVQQLAAGSLAFDPDTTCNHHHEEGHTCGEHDCGEHTCGGHHSGECR